jgi:radical SAM superfamily enzyme YgiQ (UPF0313 family)
MKVQVIKAASDYGKTSYGVGSYWSPGLLSLVSTIKAFNPTLSVELIDGTIGIQDEPIETRIDSSSDYIGFSVETSNYLNSLKLSKWIKARGNAKIVFGGIHPTCLGFEIMIHQRFIDFVIKHKGERSFSMLINGHEQSSIPGLIWRNGKQIIENDVDDRCLSIQGLPEYDFSFLEYKKYVEFHSKMVSNLPTRPYITLTHEGCKRRKQKGGGCNFCSIQQIDYYRDPSEVWNELSLAKKELDIGFVRDFGDDIAGNIEWLRALALAKPKSFDLPLFVYVSTKELRNREIVRLLKEINVQFVFIGFESANNAMLKALNKKTSVEQHYRAIELLSKEKIRIFASFVLGAPGETLSSLEDTYQFSQRIVELGNVPYLSASALIPFPGSKNYKDLARLFPKKYEKIDYLDIEESMLDWAGHFCPALGPDDYSRFQKLIDYEIKINESSEIKSYFLNH